MSEYRLLPLRGKHGKGRFAKVSVQDFERVNELAWMLDSKGYVLSANKHGPKEIRFRLHRFVLRLGKTSHLTVVDHINGDTLDNTRENLRVCTQQQNCWNSKGKRSRDKLNQYKGVCFVERNQKWQAKIMLDRKQIFLGYYATEIEAARAYDGCALYHYGEFAQTNFSDVQPESLESLRARRRKIPTSEYHGVHWDKGHEKWMSRVFASSIDGKQALLAHSYFDDELQAAKFYDQAILRLGLNRPLNLPSEPILGAS